jgi:hypothetical protein
LIAFSICLAAATWPDSACADAKLEATYRITFAHISVGEATMTADLGESEYTVALVGRAGGVARMVVNGEAYLTASGAMKEGRPEPRNFTSKTISEGESQTVSMALEEGRVTEFTVTPPPGDGSLDVPEADRRGIIDPLTAMLVSADVPGEALSQDACRGALAIFGGRQRFNLRLTFKRMDKVSAKKGYAGPAVVCSATYQPIAGVGPSNPLVKYLSDNRDMELVLAPVQGTRLLAPFGLSIGSTLANVVIWATRFETATQLP